MLVIGLKHGAGEGAVAAALAAVLRREGTDARVVKPEDLDLAGLKAELAEDGVIGALPGGLLGSLAARYTARDLAAELRRPVVLATPADADAVNLVRLSLAAARAARLQVAAVVLTGWPEAPSREQGADRRLLGEVAGVDVRTLPESPAARADVVRDWPAGDWMTAAPPPAPEPVKPVTTRATPAAAARAAGVELEPYDQWTPRPTGDPRSTPRPRIMEALLEIVAAEGPIVAGRLFALYNRSSGGKKLTTAARQPLESSLRWLGQEQKLIVADGVARLPDQPAVRVRALGDRTLEEVPLDEIAELMRRLGGPDKRAVLNAYGLVRLTQRADEYLNAASELISGPTRG